MKKYSLKDIFDPGEDGKTIVKKILIPMIQRDYAQGRRDDDTKRKRRDFLDSLYKAVTGQSGINLDFVYGDVTDNENQIMTPLDGQQRLTTLFLLYWYATKKEKIPNKEYSFLKNFTYETRDSSRQFCEYIIDFPPIFNCLLSEEIKEQAWFPFDWENDPTIDSMLVMIDDINEKFAGVAYLWNALVNQKKITFYFLPIKDMGLTDDIYIKMNSRGKLLTEFEILKAELEKNIKPINVDYCTRISNKFDNVWNDLMWQYTKPQCEIIDDILPSDYNGFGVDDAFLNYFRFVCDIISYKEEGTINNRTKDYSELVDLYFNKDKCQDAEDHILFLEEYFDCWIKLNDYSTPKEFFNDFVSSEHSEWKVMKDETDMLEKCLTSIKSGDFNLPRKVFLYAVIEYLRHKDTIEKSDFLHRIRIINNLIDNSKDNILFDRDDGRNTRIQTVLRQVDSIIQAGVILDDIGPNFNAYQLEEEKIKIKYIEKHPDEAESIFTLEDHELLYGQVGIILFGSDGDIEIPSSISIEDYVKRFNSLFECDWDKVNCAMMTFGNYSQKDGNSWKRRIGSRSSARKEPWKLLFHKNEMTLGPDGGYDKTREVIRKLLESNDSFDNSKLDKIISDFTDKCEQEHKYPWEYYFIKYEEFRPNGYGKLIDLNNQDETYMFEIMEKQRRNSQSTYMPFLLSALNSDDWYNDDIAYYDVTNWDCYVIHGNKRLFAENNCYRIRSYNADGQETDNSIIRIPQENGIDKVDRIVLLHNYLYTQFFMDIT